jgi:hypothetical protein
MPPPVKNASVWVSATAIVGNFFTIFGQNSITFDREDQF